MPQFTLSPLCLLFKFHIHIRKWKKVHYDFAVKSLVKRNVAWFWQLWPFENNVSLPSQILHLFQYHLFINCIAFTFSNYWNLPSCIISSPFISTFGHRIRPQKNQIFIHGGMTLRSEIATLWSFSTMHRPENATGQDIYPQWSSWSCLKRILPKV